MTSVPKPLKFLRPHYGTLKSYFDIMPESELKVLFLTPATMVIWMLIWHSADISFSLFCRSTWLTYCLCWPWLCLSKEKVYVHVIVKFCSYYGTYIFYLENFSLFRSRSSEVALRFASHFLIVSGEPEVPFIGLWRWHWFLGSWICEVRTRVLEYIICFLYLCFTCFCSVSWIIL
jgi:hypothetical protein